MTTQQLRRYQPYNESLCSQVHPWPVAQADLGNYFTATNATPGTPVAYGVAASYSATQALFTLRNGGTSGATATSGGPVPAPNIYLHYIRLLLSQVPASAASAQFAVFLDNTKRGTVGTALTPNPASLNQFVINAPTSVADFRYNPTVAAAGASAYQLERGTFRSVIPVTGDEYLFVFGDAELTAGASGTLAGTTAVREVVPCAPVVLGANGNQTALFHVWFPSNVTTAASFEFELGWVERAYC